jgi:ABC-type transporter Mla subunit MlaD
MTKRDRACILRQVKKIETFVGKKRDELREAVAEMEQLIESVATANDDVDGVLYHLRQAADELDRHVVDKLSEFV